MDVRKAIYDRRWDLIILFPPCTHTCLSGNGTWAGTPERIEGMKFTYDVWWAAIHSGASVALEQPMTMVGRMLGKCTQRVNLWWFGDEETKETWLWLSSDLPLLVADRPTKVRNPKVHFESPGIKNGLTRSQRRQTLRPGFARAMAEQWGLIERIAKSEEELLEAQGTIAELRERIGLLESNIKWKGNKLKEAVIAACTNKDRAEKAEQQLAAVLKLAQEPMSELDDSIVKSLDEFTKHLNANAVIGSEIMAVRPMVANNLLCAIQEIQEQFIERMAAIVAATGGKGGVEECLES